MPAVMVAPVATVMSRGAVMADDARTMHGQNPAAASSSNKGGSVIDRGINVIIGVVIRIVVVIDAADKSPAEVTPVNEPVAGKSRSPRDNRGRRADRTAMNDGSATHASGTAATTPPAASAAATVAAASTATNLDHQSMGGRLANASACRMDR